MSLSVALCTHNGSAHVAEQLRSILNQTLLPDEVIVSDDASADDTVRVVEDTFAAWQADHPGRIELRVLCNEAPLGVTANFEQALTACGGELIALSDQDDVWHPHRLERMVAGFADRPDLLVLHADARLVDSGGAPLGTTLLGNLGVSANDLLAEHEGKALDLLLRRNVATGATMVLRRDLVRRARPFPPAWLHDEWLAVVAAATGTVDVLEEPLVDYRQHAAQQIGASSLDTAGKFARLREPRTERNARLLARAEALQGRLKGLVPAASVDTIHKIEAKLSHERMRQGIPGPRFARVLPVLREWRSGAYRRYGLGLQDVLRDLVQPV